MITGNSKTNITGVPTVGVPVSDQAAAFDFYVEVLGFEKRRDAPFGGGRWIEVAPPGSATSIALIPTHAGQPIGVDTGIRLSTKDAQADHAALLIAGIDADTEVMRTGDVVPPMFAFRDRDGNRLVIVEER
jgi:catechol 2,3-dioxygenase-like lactoylglutathione lyase family enzyme